MSDAVNMVDFVKGDLSARPRGRAAVVLTRDYAGQKAWAAELARQTDAAHIHLLDQFAADPKLAASISGFLVDPFFDYIAKQVDTRVLIVSGMEFLKATWSGSPSAVGQFARRVQTWQKSPCLLFVLQHDTALTAHDFGSRYGYRFIVDQKDTFQL